MNYHTVSRALGRTLGTRKACIFNGQHSLEQRRADSGQGLRRHLNVVRPRPQPPGEPLMPLWLDCATEGAPAANQKQGIQQFKYYWWQLQ